MTQASDILRMYSTREDRQEAIAQSDCVRTFDDRYNYYIFYDGSGIKRDTSVYSSSTVGAYFKDYEIM
jgi:hypothetical protein